MTPNPDIHSIIQKFQTKGDYLGAHPYGQGNINDTFVVSFQGPDGKIQRYILQRINKRVFTKPEEVMQNIKRVTDHIKKKIINRGGNPARKTITIVPTLDGDLCFKSQVDEYWRVYLFLEGARTYYTAMEYHHYYNCGWLFGEFLTLLIDFPVSKLFKTIPDFHNPGSRFREFIASVDRDDQNRAYGIKPEIELICQRKTDIDRMDNLLKQGLIPEIVTHNDTKIDNVMVDDKTGEGLCLIDLDTVMPGISIFDFGDAVRSGANLAGEDEQNLLEVKLDLEIFDNLAHGFLDSAHGILSPTEVDHLVFGTKLITLEQAIRFLTDYLNGDNYYKITRSEQNLDRARTQIALVIELEKMFDSMQTIIDKYR